MNENKRGFTLVEVLVASAIALLVCLSLFLFSYAVHENVAAMSGVLFAGEKGRIVIGRIAKDLREAVTILDAHGSYETDDDTLVFDIPAIDINGEAVNPESTFDTVIYTLNPLDTAEILRIVDAHAMSARADTSETIAGCVESLEFSSQGSAMSDISSKGAAKNITMRIVTKATVFENDHTAELVSAVSLRNKSMGF